MTRTNVAFIGAGTIAKRHMGDVLGFDDVRVVAVTDPVVERAGELATPCGGRAYSSVEEMLDREQLDAVYVCVPPFAHGAPELAVIERGLPFFVEKPLAVDLPKAEHIADQVAQRGLITGTGYHWRYLDITEHALELLSRNPARLALGYWLDFTPPPAWWVVESLSGGQMVEQTTHIFDLARLLVGDVTRVYAATERLDRAAFPGMDVAEVSMATLHFASGALGSVSSTCLLKWPHRIGLHLFSEGMAIELSEFEIMVDVGRGRPVQTATGDPFVREDRDFIDAVQGKQNRVRAPYAEALKTHRLSTTAARSAREAC
ncbi:MAG: Gfo/Idh/MocA family oxidoreductase [Chloroflexi bacterium]|nr:Gfo/Idh/MocA family oxidoreductase [Chloroflexota bacterium]